MSDKPFRVFIGKHPCDDEPWIVGTDPDPRSDEFKERFDFDGEDYSGWYEKVWRCRWCGRRTHGVFGLFHKPTKCKERP